MSIAPKPYKQIDFPPLTDGQKEELRRLAEMPEEEIDTGDAPACEFKNAQFYYVQSLKMPKTKIYTSIDDDILEWLKSAGKGYQKRLNDALRWARLNGFSIDNPAQ